jgi:hypothetical protein
MAPSGCSWPAVRVHAPRRKAAVEDFNVGSVERSGNWCSRPLAVFRDRRRSVIRAAAPHQTADLHERCDVLVRLTMP